MKISFLLFIFFSFTSLFSSAFGQEIRLNDIDEKIINSINLEYHDLLKEKGFTLLESGKEGENGIYESWISKDENLFLTIQNNNGIGFTKIIVSPESNNSKTVERLISEINKEYSNKTIENEVYYINDKNPKTTVHLIKLERNGQYLSSVMFFHKD